MRMRCRLAHLTSGCVTIVASQDTRARLARSLALLRRSNATPVGVSDTCELTPTLDVFSIQ